MMLKIEKTDEKLTPLDGEKINLRGRLSNKTWKMAVLTQKHAFVHVRNEFRRSFNTSYANKTIFAVPSSFLTHKKCFGKLYCCQTLRKQSRKLQ